MARIEPFRALRPRPDLARQVASPPYDVLSGAEARAMVAGNPHSFLHVIKPEIDLSPGTEPYDEAVYAKGAENLRRMVNDGTLVREETATFYIYRQHMGAHTQTGLVAGAAVDEYEAGSIKKHEFTRPAKEDDRTRHVDALDANTGPVFLTYHARRDINTMVDRLTARAGDYDFTAVDGIRHVVWVVGEPTDRNALVSAFARIPALYVADGHHRSAAAARIRRQRAAANPGHTGEEGYNFFLSVIFPHDEMLIMAYHRVVQDLNGLDPQAFLSAVKERFTIEETRSPEPTETRTFGMYLGTGWYRLTARDGSYPTDDPVNRLDVAILQRNLLGPILGIGDPRSDERIDFIGGIRGLDELVRRVDAGQHAVAFALFPTSIQELFLVADAGEVMPPKSTWFEPKLRSGLIVRPL